ncbi:YihY/virulence factor BrkB family protein [Sphingomonas sp. KR1UV-12]|uniref:YihY/virulence factor BrkB family protein n=1 Tax=Sphingomonas aurea TaxID=3063994 RepID=A0ABT9EIQ1_9SPHN|nr:YihY/virulence factor BrkB family protein [Sphingomonas sp. KR1UV-12]MDP1026847.1 YihY/virulence factor BrkB family protein [Sphingomonas sp. KR1UV-12]
MTDATRNVLANVAVWLRLMMSTVRGALLDDFGIAASSIAFAAFLALVPLIGLIASAYGMIASPETVSRNIARLVAILPPDAQRVVAQGLATKLALLRENVATTVVALGVTLFSARRAGRSLLHGINLAYRIEHERSGVRRQLVSTLLVLGCAALLLTALISLSVLAFLQSYVPDGLPGARLVSTVILFGSLTLGAGFGLIVTYRYAPACKPIPWRCALPGTIAGVVMWLCATSVFRVYVSRFASFDDTYGSLAAVVVLMLWLMVSAWVLLLGARLNAEAMRWSGTSIIERDE